MSTKREVVSKAVGESLEALSAALKKGTADGDDEDDGDVTPSFTVSFHPTEGGVVITEPRTEQVATGADVAEALEAFYQFDQDLDTYILSGYVGENDKCRDCGIFPCISAREYSNMLTLGEHLKDKGMAPDGIRHRLYRFMTRVVHGYLGAGNRKELPACVLADIRDAYPNTDGTPFVGFKKAPSNDDEEEE